MAALQSQDDASSRLRRCRVVKNGASLPGCPPTEWKSLPVLPASAPRLDIVQTSPRSEMLLDFQCALVFINRGPTLLPAQDVGVLLDEARPLHDMP